MSSISIHSGAQARNPGAIHVRSILPLKRLHLPLHLCCHSPISATRHLLPGPSNSLAFKLSPIPISQLILPKAVRVLFHGEETNQSDYAPDYRLPVAPYCPAGLLRLHPCSVSSLTTWPLHFTPAITNSMAVLPGLLLPLPGPLLLSSLPPCIPFPD